MGKRQRIKDSLTLTLVMSKLGGRYNDPLTLTVSKIWGHPTILPFSSNILKTVLVSVSFISTESVPLLNSILMSSFIKFVAGAFNHNMKKIIATQISENAFFPIISTNQNNNPGPYLPPPVLTLQRIASEYS